MKLSELCESESRNGRWTTGTRGGPDPNRPFIWRLLPLSPPSNSLVRKEIEYARHRLRGTVAPIRPNFRTQNNGVVGTLSDMGVTPVLGGRAGLGPIGAQWLGTVWGFNAVSRLLGSSVPDRGKESPCLYNLRKGSSSREGGASGSKGAVEIGPVRRVREFWAVRGEGWRERWSWACRGTDSAPSARRGSVRGPSTREGGGPGWGAGWVSALKGTRGLPPLLVANRTRPTAPSPPPPPSPPPRNFPLSRSRHAPTEGRPWASARATITKYSPRPLRHGGAPDSLFKGAREKPTRPLAGSRETRRLGGVDSTSPAPRAIKAEPLHEPWLHPSSQPLKSPKTGKVWEH